MRDSLSTMVSAHGVQFSLLTRGIAYGFLFSTTGCSLLFDFTERTEASREACQNGWDDDVDGLVDCDDLECQLAGFCSESSFESCGQGGPEFVGDGDGIDNDGDGAVDCADASCDGFCVETTSSLCTDGRDNDGDGLSDYEDPGCWGVSPPIQNSCLSSDQVQIAVDLWTPGASLSPFETRSGVVFGSEKIFDGNWRDIHLELSLRGQSIKELISTLSFESFELALIPAAPGDEVPSNLKETALVYMSVKGGENIVRVLAEERVLDEPIQALRIWDERLTVVTAEGKETEVDLGSALADLPTHRPARLFLRVPPRAAAAEIPSSCDGYPTGGGFSWTLAMDAPGRLPCGELNPRRGVEADSEMCAVQESEPSQSDGAALGIMGAASIGVGPGESTCRVDEFPPLELSSGVTLKVLSHSITWDDTERLWRAVAWAAGRHLILMTSPDCLNWSTPVRVLTESTTGALGMPSYVAGGPFGYPTRELIVPRHHIFFTTEAETSRERVLYHLTSKDLMEWSEAVKVYSFEASDLVREPVRVVTVSGSELLTVYRVEETLQSSVGILRATKDDLSEWERTMPWPFRVGSSNPTTVDSEGLGGAVLYFSGGEGVLLADGRPTEDYLVVDGDRVGKFELTQETISEEMVKSFPPEHLFDRCNNNAVCDLGESCESCSSDCDCSLDMLSGACWQIEHGTGTPPKGFSPTGFSPSSFSVQKKHMVMSADTYTLRGRLHQGKDASDAKCLPFVSVTSLDAENSADSDETGPYSAPVNAGSLALFLNPGPVAQSEIAKEAFLREDHWPALWSIDSTRPSLFSEWAFEFQKSQDEIWLRVWDPLGCEILSRRAAIKGGAETAVAVGTMGDCDGAFLTKLYLVVGDDAQ